MGMENGISNATEIGCTGSKETKTFSFLSTSQIVNTECVNSQLLVNLGTLYEC